MTNSDDSIYSTISSDGLTKREYFAVKMFQAIIQDSIVDFDEDAKSCTPKARAEQAILLADALIAELSKQEGD